MTWPDTYFVFSMSSCHLEFFHDHGHTPEWRAEKPQNLPFRPRTLQPHLKELVHPRNLKTPNFVLHSNSNLTPAFLKLSDTANVRFQDVFLKF